MFLDESACNRLTTKRLKAWAPCGERARRRDFFIRGIRFVLFRRRPHSELTLYRYSILPAICLDGVLYLDILTRSWTAAEFREYLDTLLDLMNPFPQDNSVLVMDNASVHHFDGIREMVEGRCVPVMFSRASITKQ